MSRCVLDTGLPAVTYTWRMEDNLSQDFFSTFCKSRGSFGFNKPRPPACLCFAAEFERVGTYICTSKSETMALSWKRNGSGVSCWPMWRSFSILRSREMDWCGVFCDFDAVPFCFGGQKNELADTHDGNKLSGFDLRDNLRSSIIQEELGYLLGTSYVGCSGMCCQKDTAGQIQDTLSSLGNALVSWRS